MPGSADATLQAPAPGVALDVLARLIARLPRRWLAALGACVGWIAGTLFRYRRAHVESAMERAGIPGARDRARSLYRELGTSLLEVLSLGVLRATPRGA